VAKLQNLPALIIKQSTKNYLKNNIFFISISIADKYIKDNMHY
jgi:hypothetical protein